MKTVKLFLLICCSVGCSRQVSDTSGDAAFDLSNAPGVCSIECVKRISFGARWIKSRRTRFCFITGKATINKAMVGLIIGRDGLPIDDASNRSYIRDPKSGLCCAIIESYNDLNSSSSHLSGDAEGKLIFDEMKSRIEGKILFFRTDLGGIETYTSESGNMLCIIIY